MKMIEKMGGTYRQEGDYLLPDIEAPESPQISDGFKELEEFLCDLPLDDNNAVFNLCCRLCSAYEHKAFVDGLLYGSNLILELNSAELKVGIESTDAKR